MPANERERPNVVVFLTDQQRWDTTGVHGNPLDLTPNFDRMARQGTHLFHAFTPQPVCAPARACFQTGRYPTTTGCYRNGIPLPADARTLAHLFHDSGYATGYIGKWHLAAHEPVPVAERGGYRYWLAANLLEFVSTPYRTVLYNGANEAVRLPGYRVDAVADAGIRYIADHADRPFFLFLSFLEPHHQNSVDDFPPPDGYRERYTGRWMPPDLAALGGTAPQHLGGYYGQVKRLDEALGRTLDALTSLGLRDDTIVLFVSDHGCHFKTRNGEYKRSPHESAIRVPAALSGAAFTGGGQVRELVSLIDLPPTLLDAVGIPIPPEMQGRSILPLVRGERADWADDVFIQVSESQVGRAVRTRRWKYSVVAPDKDGWNDMSSGTYVEQHLYDLEADPCELTDLIGCASHERVSAALRERLVRRMVAAGEPAPVIHPAPTRICGELRVPPEDVPSVCTCR